MKRLFLKSKYLKFILLIVAILIGLIAIICINIKSNDKTLDAKNLKKTTNDDTLNSTTITGNQESETECPTESITEGNSESQTECPTGSITESTTKLESTTNTTSTSPADRYSELAKNVPLHAEGATITRWSDKDIDNPAMAGSWLKNIIISEELKITNRCKTKVTDSELKWLRCVIYYETCSEPYEGKLAAANVILNRYYDYANCNWWPDTIEEIIFQKGQFGALQDCHWNETVADYDNGKFTTDNHLLAIKAVDDALSGVNNIGTRVGFNFYYMEKNKNHINPVRIQNNLFWDIDV